MRERISFRSNGWRGICNKAGEKGSGSSLEFCGILATKYVIFRHLLHTKRFEDQSD